MAHLQRLVAVLMLFPLVSSGYQLDWTGPESVDGVVCAQIRVSGNGSYNIANGSLYFNSPEEAAAHFQAWYTANSEQTWTIGAPIRNSNTTNFGISTHSSTQSYCQKANPASCGSLGAVQLQSRLAPDAAVSCPPPAPECGNPGDGELVTGRTATWAQFVSEVGSCLDNCEVESVKRYGPGINKDAAGTFFYSGWVKYTGNQCAVADDQLAPSEAPDDPANEPVGENCITSAAGVEYCSAAYGENCGYVNDVFTCLGKTDPDECWVNSDGSRLCGESAPIPPRPDNGTPGVPAAPDDVVKAQGPSSENTYNYYNSGTVAGSARPPGSSGANPNRPGSQDPSTGGGQGEQQESGGSASGGTTCAEAPVCEGDAIACAQLTQAWRARCHFDGDATQEGVLAAMGATTAEKEGDLSHGQVGQDISTMLDADGGYAAPACPAPLNVSMFGQSMSFDLWAYACQFALAFAPFTMVMGYLSAASILLQGVRK